MIHDLVDLIEEQRQNLCVDMTYGYEPESCEAMLDTLDIIKPYGKKSSLELGCGDGAWTLLTSFYGYTSIGIDINPDYVNHANRVAALAKERGLLTTVPKFIVGNMFQNEWYDKYRETDNAISSGSTKNPFTDISIADFEIILNNPPYWNLALSEEMIRKEMSPDALYVCNHGSVMEQGSQFEKIPDATWCILRKYL